MSSEDFNFRFDCGYTKANIKLEDRDEMITTIALHFLVYRVHGEICQLQLGMKETLNFGHLIEVSGSVLILYVPCSMQTDVYMAMLYTCIVCLYTSCTNDYN